MSLTKEGVKVKRGSYGYFPIEVVKTGRGNFVNITTSRGGVLTYFCELVDGNVRLYETKSKMGSELVSPEHVRDEMLKKAAQSRDSINDIGDEQFADGIYREIKRLLEQSK